MSNAKFQIELPVNEPVKSYAPGSSEKIEFKSVLESMTTQIVDLPLVINGEKVFTDKKDDIADDLPF